MADFSVDQLTQEQRDQIPALKQKWVDVVMDTRPVNVDEVRPYINLAYQQHGHTPPIWIIHARGPVESSHMCLLLRDIVDYRIATGQFRFPKGKASRKKFCQFFENACEHLKPQVIALMSEFPDPQTGATVRIDWEKEWPELIKSYRRYYASDKDKMESEYQTGVHHHFYGNHDAHWFLYYDFFKNVVKQDIRDVSGLQGITEHCGWWAPYDKVCIVQDRIEELHIDPEISRLHKDFGPAMKFRDGLKIWQLNGVMFPDEYAWVIERQEGHFNAEDCRKILQIPNVEVRQEAIRKVGANILCNRLQGKVIDTSDNGMYDLMEFDLKRDDRVKSKALRMQNPSIDAEHYEWVPDECRTVQEAICFRNHMTPDQIDDVNGEEYIQQGDVLLFKKSDVPWEKRKFRSRPSQLT